jgi:hypothetical protein
VTAYGFTVWGRIASTGTCRHCKQPIVWRTNRKTGRLLPFNGVLGPLHTFVDETNLQPMEVLSRDDLHVITCTKRPGRRDAARAEAHV